MSIKVSIVEDNQTVRQSLAEILDSTPGFRLGDACASGEDALQCLLNNPPDVVLMDINLPRLSGVQCVRELKRCLPKTQFIMLTIEDDSQRVFESLQAGATGYLLKNVPPERILAAVEEVHRGGSPMSSQIARMLVQTFQSGDSATEREMNLTKRESEILRLLTRGYRSKEVAGELAIGVQTVHTHLRNIYEKLHVRSRAEAVARFLGG
ncbi:MAG: response regulator transcription factor [Verrucomicrobiales bacterium]|nr:response regulator transcription factor [Verrucomicrobiales bacterium]